MNEKEFMAEVMRRTAALRASGDKVYGIASERLDWAMEDLQREGRDALRWLALAVGAAMVTNQKAGLDAPMERVVMGLLDHFGSGRTVIAARAAFLGYRNPAAVLDAPRTTH